MRKKILTLTALLLAAALLFAACAVPQPVEEQPTTIAPTEAAPPEATPFSPQEIATMTQGFATVGDFVALMPAVEYRLWMNVDLHIAFYNRQPEYHILDMDFPFLEIRVPEDIGDGIYYKQTLPSELLATPAQLVMFRLSEPGIGLALPRGIDVGAPAQAVLDSFSCAQLRENVDDSEHFIAIEYPPELVELRQQAEESPSPSGRIYWNDDMWWLSYHIENDIIESIFFRHTSVQ